MPFETPVDVLDGPRDIADWAETARITRVEFQPGNFLVRHTKEGKRPDSWPPQHVDGWGNGRDDPGDIQWTLYIVIWADGRWVTGPCILFYPEDVPSLGVHRGSDGAPFSSAARNWYYQIGGMAGRQPSAGARIGVLAVAGALRGLNVQAVHERSAIAWVTVPPGDSGVYTFDAEPLPATPPPAPSDPPATPDIPVPSPDRLLAILEQTYAILQDQSDALGRLEATVATKADLAALRQELLEVSKTIASALTATSTPNAALAALNRLLGRRA